MRQKLGFIITVVIVVVILMVMNSLTFVTQEEKSDSELLPDRSTYHRGSTGTKALYDLLSEGGYSVMRWRETSDKLLSQDRVRTFVIVGNTKQMIDEDEARTILQWVKRGGRLVIVDRRPEVALIPRSGDWDITTQLLTFPAADVDPADATAMTQNVKPVAPSQVTDITRDIQQVLPSRFAATVRFAFEREEQNENSPAASQTPQTETVEPSASVPRSPAPVVHFQTEQGPLVVDYTHGNGRIIVLTDPYMVSNGGISLANNLQLAINMLASAGGLIAFDEFHQGHAATRNAIAA